MSLKAELGERMISPRPTGGTRADELTMAMLRSGATQATVGTWTRFRDAIRRDRVLVIVLAAVLASHLVYIGLDRKPFTYDDSWYAETSIRFLNAWANEGVRGAYRFFEQKTFMGNKAPLIILLPQPLLLLFGRHNYVFPLSNAICLVVALLYLSALARRLVSRNTAVLAVVVFSLLPLTAYLTRQFFVEILLTTIVLMFVYHLVASDEFTRAGHSLAAGAAFGLGMLTKATFPVFAVGAAAVVLVKMIRRHKTRLSWLGWLALGCAGPGVTVIAEMLAQPWGWHAGLGLSFVVLVLLLWRCRRGWRVNFCAAAAIATWLTLTWYLHNARTVLTFLRENSFGSVAADYNTGLLNYWVENINVGFGVVFTISLGVAVALALLTSFMRSRSTASTWYTTVLVFAWVMPPLVIFTLGTNRTTRFLLPIMPGVALGYATLLHVLASRMRGVGWAVAAAHTGFALWAYAVLTFGGPTKRFGPHHEFIAWGPELTAKGPISRVGYPVHEVALAAWGVAPHFKGRDTLAMFLTDSVHVNQNTMCYTAVKLGIPMFYGLVPYGGSRQPAVDAMSRADLLVFQEGGPAAQYPDFTNRWGRVMLDEIRRGEHPEWRIRGDPVVSMQDGSVVRFLERAPPSPRIDSTNSSSTDATP